VQGAVGGYLESKVAREEEEGLSRLAEVAKGGDPTAIAEAATKAGYPEMAIQLALTNALMGRQQQQKAQSYDIITGSMPPGSTMPAGGGPRPSGGPSPTGQPQEYDFNIGNLVATDTPWAGKGAPFKNKAGLVFETFSDPVAGVSAAYKNILFHVSRGADTFEKLAAILGPKDDGQNPYLKGNNPSAWAAHVARAVGLRPGDPIPVNDPQAMARMMRGINLIEKGRQTVPDQAYLAGVTGQQPTGGPVQQAQYTPPQGDGGLPPASAPATPPPPAVPPGAGGMAPPTDPATQGILGPYGENGPYGAPVGVPQPPGYPPMPASQPQSLPTPRATPAPQLPVSPPPMPAEPVATPEPQPAPAPAAAPPVRPPEAPPGVPPPPEYQPTPNIAAAQAQQLLRQAEAFRAAGRMDEALAAAQAAQAAQMKAAEHEAAEARRRQEFEFKRNAELRAQANADRQAKAGEKLTDSQGKDYSYALRLARALPQIEQLAYPGQRPTGAERFMANPPTVAGIEVVPGMRSVYSWLAPQDSDRAQRFAQLERDIINAILRRESGATISPDEFANARQQYIPQPSDSPDVTRQKLQNLRSAFEGMSISSGRPADFGFSGQPSLKPPDVPGPPKQQGGELKKKYGLE
jgi:hypothetical protein